MFVSIFHIKGFSSCSVSCQNFKVVHDDFCFPFCVSDLKSEFRQIRIVLCHNFFHSGHVCFFFFMQIVLDIIQKRVYYQRSWSTRLQMALHTTSHHVLRVAVPRRCPHLLCCRRVRRDHVRWQPQVAEIADEAPTVLALADLTTAHQVRQEEDRKICRRWLLRLWPCASSASAVPIRRRPSSPMTDCRRVLSFPRLCRTSDKLASILGLNKPRCCKRMVTLSQSQ